MLELKGGTRSEHYYTYADYCTDNICFLIGKHCSHTIITANRNVNSKLVMAALV